MANFLQLHFLTSYPPSNLNRDDMGSPKTASMGGVNRLRISSQCLKRTWRTSDQFQTAAANHLGTRTKLVGRVAYEKLIALGVDEKSAKDWAKKIAGVFGSPKAEAKEPASKEAGADEKAKAGKKDKSLQDLEIGQLVHVSPEEFTAATETLPALLAERKSAPTADELNLLRANAKGVDIAMFGRMLASSPEYNVEAAVQVSHAVTVHAVTIDDDYFTAVDDLKTVAEDAGAAHIGESAFGAGLFYTYVCIDREQLHANLNDDELERRAVGALIEAAAMVSPKGKQNSFASRTYASYILASKGNQQPCSLAAAFLAPISRDYLNNAVQKLELQKGNFESAYGPLADAFFALDTSGESTVTTKGSILQLKEFAAS